MLRRREHWIRETSETNGGRKRRGEGRGERKREEKKSQQWNETRGCVSVSTRGVLGGAYYPQLTIINGTTRNRKRRGGGRRGVHPFSGWRSVAHRVHRFVVRRARGGKSETQNGPSIQEVGTWIKSERGQRLGDRAISDLERGGSWTPLVRHHVGLLASRFPNGFLAALRPTRSYYARRSVGRVRNSSQDLEKPEENLSRSPLGEKTAPIPSYIALFLSRFRWGACGEEL